MKFKISVLHGFRLSRKHPGPVICIAVLLALSPFTSLTAWADGCFVFKWNKAIDINEPTQKAIIVHDAGREDLLLQVKYEGPLEEFGWLIPVPTVPQLSKGSMQPFYELSQLTQRRFGVVTAGLGSVDASTGLQGLAEPVKVIEIKTVGAYEVAVLSAKDAGSLSRWLDSHGYSIPDGKADILDDYIRKGWYFVAAKIQLSEGAATFKMAANNSPAKSNITTVARSVVKSRLSRGELHPLLISFDTPVCVFPLKISAVGGKPSEVSLYVFSAEPLLDPFIFGKACEKLDRQHAEWTSTKSQREKSRSTSMHNMRMLGIAASMYSVDRKGANRIRSEGNYSRADVEALARETEPPLQPWSLGETFYAPPGELLQCLQVKPDQIVQCMKALPRLSNRTWYLTKQVWTFTPETMHDLEFRPAIRELSGALQRPSGEIAAQMLAEFGVKGVAALTNACASANSRQRMNAAFGLRNLRGEPLAGPLMSLLQDEAPRARLYAVETAELNWDPKLIQPVFALLRDPDPEIRMAATSCLCQHETKERSSSYVPLLEDSDPAIRGCSFGVLSQIDPDAISRATFLKLLRGPDQNLQIYALKTLDRTNRYAVTREDLLPLLSTPRIEVASMALHHLQNSWPGPTWQGENPLPSTEAVRLTTNQIAMVRLIGLRILQNNSDAEAVELALPLLSDTNSVVRTRAFAFLRTATGQEIAQADTAGWKKWWAANKATFQPRKPPAE